MGGLGNQMFQYALGRRLADERAAPLQMDLSYFEAQRDNGLDTVRTYALDGWRVRAAIASHREGHFRASSCRRPRLRRHAPWLFPPVVVEEGLGFDPRILRVPRSTYLSGYWQSEKYFIRIRRVLLEDFSLSKPPCTHVAGLAEHARHPGAVAVHVRRADYVSNAQRRRRSTGSARRVLSHGVRRPAEQVGDVQFLVFGDDLQWARENLQFEWPTVVVAHDLACLPHNDIWLMSYVSHHIIANSSFSWWGPGWQIEPVAACVCAAALVSGRATQHFGPAAREMEQIVSAMRGFE